MYQSWVFFYFQSVLKNKNLLKEKLISSFSRKMKNYPHESLSYQGRKATNSKQADQTWKNGPVSPN